MVCPVNKIDSNGTGLRFAEEQCLKQLPVSGVVWYALEPNSYSDFGGQLTTVARAPINPSRQRKKGVVTDLTASGGFNQDLTIANTLRLMQGFMFASAREKGTTAPMNAAATAITAVAASDKSYSNAAVAQFKAGHLVVASGFTNTANNGLKNVVTSATGKTTVTQVTVDEAAPPAAAQLQVVGFQFPSADVQMQINGALPRLVSAATDLTTLGLIPGEWVFLGGDSAASAFAVSHGWARINTITTTTIQFDKSDWTATAEAGTGKTIQMFMGTLIINEQDPTLIVRRTYDIERTLGSDAVGVMSEHLTGAVANEFTMNCPQADKVNVDLTFVACDNEQRTGTDGLKPGSRPSLPASDAFNTSSDFSRIKLSSVDPTTSTPVPLFAFATDLTVTINNNASGAKALGVLGAFDTNVGTFEVGGNITAYFADMTGVKAVRNNADITIDVVLAKNNVGIVFDIPLLALGNGRLAVEKDKPITLPLDMTAGQSSYGNTLTFMVFPYVPNIAQ